MRVDERRAIWNGRARTALQTKSRDVLPAAVLAHALQSRWIPRTARAAVDAYWRAHPIRAERLCRNLATRSGTPTGWKWRIGAEEQLPASFRVPPTPYREPMHRAGPGTCVVCGQKVFRFGWHVDRWGSGVQNHRAEWHGCCVAAWKFWLAPANHRKALSRMQERRCALSGARLLRNAEVDHRTPLFQVWRDHRDLPWPELLSFWGLPNLQVVNSVMHDRKSVEETRTRARLRSGSQQSSSASAGDPIHPSPASTFSEATVRPIFSGRRSRREPGLPIAEYSVLQHGRVFGHAVDRLAVLHSLLREPGDMLHNARVEVKRREILFPIETEALREQHRHQRSDAVVFVLVLRSRTGCIRRVGETTRGRGPEVLGCIRLLLSIDLAEDAM